jgi:peptidoglycan lytic transglycosylase G
MPGCLISLVLILCLGVFAVGGLFIGLPLAAEDTFGSSSPAMDPIERAYLSLKLLLQTDTLKAPFDVHGTSQPFQVQLGESTYDITNRLETEGFIANAEAMRDYLVYAGLDTSIQAGEYSLNPRMTCLEIAHALQDATPAEVIFRILAGWRMEEIAAILPTSGLNISSDSFLDSVRNPDSSLVPELKIPSAASLEGYLFPDSYRFPRQITIDGFIHTMLDNFQLKVDSEMRTSYQNRGLTLYQAVILASIVQREAIVETEMPLIASVFLNRLSAGMKLDSDPTVQYALGYDDTKSTWWKTPLTLDDLAFSSPYNTYLQAGFPPGPISNPGLSALKAIAFPSQTEYFYFRAACDGSGQHNFSQTFEEHQQNACP